MERKGVFVCLSDGRQQAEREKIERTAAVLRQSGMEIILSDHLYAPQGQYTAAPAAERAQEVMTYFRDRTVTDIFDISGGDAANGVLPYLDYETIGESKAVFWGYSDLTTVLNAVYARCGKPSVLYQVKNAAGSFGTIQTRELLGYLERGENALFRFPCTFVNGTEMSGIIVGGNIRCFLKLAGTPYMPDMDGKILLLEARSGQVPLVGSFLEQLQQMGVFERIQGILLGTFTQMDESGASIEELVLQKTEGRLPVARTALIGHGGDSKAVMIGEQFSVK